MHAAFLSPLCTPILVFVDAPWCVPKGIFSIMCDLVSTEQGGVLVSYRIDRQEKRCPAVDVPQL